MTFIQRWPTLVQHYINVIQMFCVCWDNSYSLILLMSDRPHISYAGAIFFALSNGRSLAKSTLDILNIYFRNYFRTRTNEENVINLY